MMETEQAQTKEIKTLAASLKENGAREKTAERKMKTQGQEVGVLYATLNAERQISITLTAELAATKIQCNILQAELTRHLNEIEELRNLLSVEQSAHKEIQGAALINHEPCKQSFQHEAHFATYQEHITKAAMFNRWLTNPAAPPITSQTVKEQLQDLQQEITQHSNQLIAMLLDELEECREEQSGESAEETEKTEVLPEPPTPR